MANISLPRDNNRITVIGGVASDDGVTPTTVYVDPTTHRMLVNNASASGTVTSVSVVSANGFAGSVATATTTPAITLSTTITGVLKGNGTAISAAVAGTDYTDAAFKTISVSGQSDVVADTPADTLTLAAGSNITITTNAGTDTVTIASTASSGITIGSTTITSGTTTRVLYDNAGVVGEYVISGSGNVAMTTSPVFTTPNIGAATATSVNGLTVTSSTGTVTITNAKTLAITNTLTLSGTDSTVMTFPTTSATIARTDAANTFTGIQTFSTPIATGSVATMTATVGGGVPTPPNNTTTFLRGDGTFAAPAGGGGYTSLGSTTLGSANATVTVSSFAAKEQLFIVFDVPTVISSAADSYMTFNSDTGSNYSSRGMVNGGGTAYIGVANIRLFTLGGDGIRTFFMNIQNRSAYVKRTTWSGAYVNGSNAVFNISGDGWWSNTADQITTLSITTGGAMTFPTNTKLTVYGMD